MKPLWSLTMELCEGDKIVDRFDIKDHNLEEIIELLERWLEALNAHKYV